MKKAEALERWASLQEAQNPLAVMEPIPYKAKGSSYGACGIRIDGTPEFIDAVMSNLKALIDGENHVTRLELSRQEVDGSKFGKEFNKKCDRAEVVYIRLHMRGEEGAMASTFFDKDHRPATERFAELIGA